MGKGEIRPLFEAHQRGRSWLSPKAAIVVLVVAAACVTVCEISMGWQRQQARELVSLPSPDSAATIKAAAAGPGVDAARGKKSENEESDVGESLDKTIRGIPLVGKPLADGLHKITNGNVRGPLSHATPSGWRRGGRMRDWKGAVGCGRSWYLATLIVCSHPQVLEPYMTNAPRVKVQFYMEALCPGCQYFSTHVLAPVMHEKGMSDLVDLEIFPAGNAELKLEKDGTMKLSCQHGEEECEGNKILACLSHIHGTDEKFVPIFTCIEQGDSSFSSTSSTIASYLNVTEPEKESRMAQLARKCMAMGNINAKEVLRCAKGNVGHRLAELSINATKSLTPKYEYAPWVVIDGKPIKEDAYSFKEWICKAYKGRPPAECDASNLKDYYPKSTQTLSSTHSSKKHISNAASPEGVKKANINAMKGHKQLLASWQGGALFDKCMPM